MCCVPALFCAKLNLGFLSAGAFFIWRVGHAAFAATRRPRLGMMSGVEAAELIRRLVHAESFWVQVPNAAFTKSSYVNHDLRCPSAAASTPLLIYIAR